MLPLLFFSNGGDAFQRFHEVRVSFDCPFVSVHGFIETSEAVEFVRVLQRPSCFFQANDVAQGGVMFTLGRIQAQRDFKFLQGLGQLFEFEKFPTFSIMDLCSFGFDLAIRFENVFVEWIFT